MTDDELKKLRALAGAATPGPWIAQPDNDAGPARVGSLATDEWFVSVDRHNGGKEYRDGWIERWVPKENANATAAFIAVARTAVPALLDEVERLRATCEGLRVEVERWETRWSLDMGEAAHDRDAYRAMLCDVIASAEPNRRDHPTMFAAWARARELLKNGPPPIATDTEDDDAR